MPNYRYHIVLRFVLQLCFKQLWWFRMNLGAGRSPLLQLRMGWDMGTSLWHGQGVHKSTSGTVAPKLSVGRFRNVTEEENVGSAQQSQYRRRLVQRRRGKPRYEMRWRHSETPNGYEDRAGSTSNGVGGKRRAKFDERPVLCRARDDPGERRGDAMTSPSSRLASVAPSPTFVVSAPLACPNRAPAVGT